MAVPAQRRSGRKPCAECPFSRSTSPGTTGGADPAVYVGQAWGPFLLPCHMDPRYASDRRDPALLQCAGAAIFRANVGRDMLLPEGLLRCPPDSLTVFATPAELIAHHRQVPVAEAEEFLRSCPPEELLCREMVKAGVRLVATRELNQE